MCSILGYYKLNNKAKVDKKFAKVAMDLMRHRGPDAESFRKFDGLVGLGSQRLSILDTREVANQPIVSKNTVIVFNGEIYNYLELKNRYLKNIHLKTASDTEVLQKGLEKYGIKFLNKTNGMFAFALFNKDRKKLIIARDRFGVKPCHYMVKDNVLYFSSEIKPLISIKHKIVRNTKIYNSFLRDTATDYDKETFVKDIYQIQKGHYLMCMGNRIIEKKWYFGKDFKFDKSIFKNKNLTVSFFEDLLTDAISKRLRSDVPVSLTLSSGLDSTTIYTLLKERLHAKVTLFTFVNSKSNINEVSNVKKLVKEYDDKLEIVKTNIKLGSEKIKEALKFLEFPIWDLSVVAYLDIYRAIHAKKYKVVIEGHGSDEQLGGYPYMVQSAAIESLEEGDFLGVLKRIKIYFDALGERKVNILEYTKMFLFILKRTLLNPNSSKSFQDCCDKAFDYQILPIVLRTFDRLTMASSVESRSPFMDFRIVEFLKLIPTEFKISEIGTKAILREILLKYHKEYIYENKRKIGFGVDTSRYTVNEFSNWKENSIKYIDSMYKIKNE